MWRSGLKRQGPSQQVEWSFRNDQGEANSVSQFYEEHHGFGAYMHRAGWVGGEVNQGTRVPASTFRPW